MIKLKTFARAHVTKMFMPPAGVMHTAPFSMSDEFNP